MTKKSLLIHPWCFALFPILSLFSYNINQIFLSDLIIPMLINLWIALFFFFLVWKLCKEIQKAGLLTSFFLLFFFSYGHLFDFISQWRTISHQIFFSLWFFFLLSGIYFFSKKIKEFQELTKILNVVSLVLICVPLSHISFYKFSKNKFSSISPRLANENNASQQATTGKETKTFPDIYFIVLDRYANEETLKERFKFDNNSFLHYLEKKKFYVARKSNANYTTTAHSLAATLNLNYINDLSQKIGENTNDILPLYERLKEYKVWRFLKSKGYKFVHLGSWWEPTRTNPNADINFVYLNDLNEFSKMLYQTTILLALYNQSSFLNPNREQWERVHYKFQKLKEISQIKEPTFTFCHMLLPHPPFVFDQEGNYQTKQIADQKGRDVCYIEQVIFTNKKLQELTEYLLSEKKEPILIFQADEGPHIKSQMKYGASFKWKEASSEELSFKMGILNAFYVPAVIKEKLYPSISPVNTFRLIFKHYFDEKLELLPDRNYIFEDSLHLYKFFDITNKLEK